METSDEHSIAVAKASVMLYDDGQRKWMPAGGAQGFSKVHIYANERTSLYRVVGRKINDHEVNALSFPYSQFSCVNIVASIQLYQVQGLVLVGIYNNVCSLLMLILPSLLF